MSKTFDDVIEYLKKRIKIHDGDAARVRHPDAVLFFNEKSREVRKIITGLNSLKKRGHIDKDQQ